MMRFLALALAAALLTGPDAASARQNAPLPIVRLFPNYFYVMPLPILIPPAAGVIDPAVATEEQR